jgi:hypothetical protein
VNYVSTRFNTIIVKQTNARGSKSLSPFGLLIKLCILRNDFELTLMIWYCKQVLQLLNACLPQECCHQNSFQKIHIVYSEYALHEFIPSDLLFSKVFSVNCKEPIEIAKRLILQEIYFYVGIASSKPTNITFSVVHYKVL